MFNYCYCYKCAYVLNIPYTVVINSNDIKYCSFFSCHYFMNGSS